MLFSTILTASNLDHIFPMFVGESTASSHRVCFQLGWAPPGSHSAPVSWGVGMTVLPLPGHLSTV